MSYVVQKTGDSFCPNDCGRVDLLTPRTEINSGPSFYLCFKCGYIGQVRVGKVRTGKKRQTNKALTAGSD